MGTALTVGQIPDPSLIVGISDFVENAFVPSTEKVSGFFGRLLGVSKSLKRSQSIVKPWTQNNGSELLIDTLNLASIDFFLDYVASLDGLKDSSEAIDKCRWRNLPYYIHSIWLPLEQQSPQPVVLEISGWPFLVGTTSGLLRDLNEIAVKSDKHLGQKPELFDLMMSNPKEFYSAMSEGLSPDDMLRWVWFAYKFGAESAASKNMPLWQAE
jgi:hypothetical protein